MSTDSLVENLIKSLVNIDEEEAISKAKKLLQEEDGVNKILDSSKKAMKIVGDKFEKNEYFIPELIMSGEILKQITSIVKKEAPQTEIDAEEKAYYGKILIGTVEGDVHDIGKNIVTFMLDINGFEVKDIGVDVPVDKFVEEIKDFKPHIVGMSGLLTLAHDSMQDTIKALEEEGIRNEIKIMIGGGCMNNKSAEYVGADAYGKNPSEAVKLAKKWMGVS